MDIACRRRSETQKKYWDSHDRHTGPIPTASIASWGGADSPFCCSPLGSRGKLAGREGPPPASEGEGLGTDLAPAPSPRRCLGRQKRQLAECHVGVLRFLTHVHGQRLGGRGRARFRNGRVSRATCPRTCENGIPRERLCKRCRGGLF